MLISFRCSLRSLRLCEITVVAVFITDPLAGVVEMEYDGEGNLLWVEDQNGNKTTYTYDQAGRRTEEKFADNKSKTFAYNLAGYLTEETDQNGSVIENTFDAAGRLVQREVTRAQGVAGKCRIGVGPGYCRIGVGPGYS